MHGRANGKLQESSASLSRNLKDDVLL